MSTKEMTGHEEVPDVYQDEYSRTVFGFWVYLLTDFMMFATLFAAYAVLRGSTFGGPSAKELFSLQSATLQTGVFLLATFFIGIGGAMAHRKNKGGTLVFFILTFLLGVLFAYLMFDDFNILVQSGNSWKRNAFLSAYFTLVGTFAAHLFFALLWVIVLLIPVFKEGLTQVSIRRLTCLRMFWQFLNIVWVFIFTFIYLIGVI